MPYIDFSNSPVKEVIIKEHYNCNHCIHKINISNGFHKCSITNDFIFINQNFDKPCKNKNIVLSKRKCLFGLFTYNKLGKTIWTGAFTCCTVNNINDNDTIKDLCKNLETGFINDNPKLKNITLNCCLLAESINGSKFSIKSNLISKEILEGIIEQANEKFL